MTKTDSSTQGRVNAAGAPMVAWPEIMEISPYTPGTSSLNHVANPIKLSSNENPFGASPKVVEAIQKAATQCHRYPEGSSQKLREAIARHYAINADQIVCGAGSDELIALLCQAYARPGEEVLYSEYGFLMYPISALRIGATPVVAPENALKASVENILKAVTDKTRVVFIANPNNPTGSYLTKTEMRTLRASLPDHVLLVIDGAYAEYVTAKDYSTGLGMVAEGNNTVMTRTFSKIYGLSSLRLGWAYCPPDIADILNRIRGPFNVSHVAQEAGIAAIEDTAFVEQSREHNELWRARVEEALTALGLVVYPSVANFLLVEFPDEPKRNAQAADIFLKEQGIIGRAMQSYGLPKSMRFTIGLETENQALIKALEAFLAR